AAAAKLKTAVFNDPALVTVEEGRTLAANQWYLLDGGAASDAFRLPTAPGAGAVTLRLQPPLRWAHPAGREVKPLALADPVTRLAEAAAAGATRVALESGAGFGEGDWVMVDDGPRTEFFLAAAHTAGAAKVPAGRPLRWPHPAGTLVRRATPGAAETRLRDAANRATATVTLTSRAALDSGALAEGRPVLLDAGAAAEVVAMGPVPAAPSATIRTVPMLAGNHAAGTALRVIGDGGRAGRLAADAPAGATELLVEGDEAGALAVGAPVGAAGGGGWTRIEALAPEVVSAGGETAFRLEGRVVADAAGMPPVQGARVVVQELQRAATTGADGRYVFGTLPPGGYTLSVSAPGFADVTKVVAVPGAGVDEYTVRMGT
ncbi:MAG TPA: carboxypeptidase regulatory-like domain-containing protein, partial [Longimicrobium sp.]